MISLLIVTSNKSDWMIHLLAVLRGALRLTDGFSDGKINIELT